MFTKLKITLLKHRQRRFLSKHRNVISHGQNPIINFPLTIDCLNLILGDNVHLYSGCVFHFGKFVIGDNSIIGENSFFLSNDPKGITIGKNVMIAAFAYFVDCDHGLDKGMLIREQPLKTSPIIIGDDVWIGAHVCILKGVHIGNGAVIGANSTVTHDVPDDAIACGTPAKVIGYRK